MQGDGKPVCLTLFFTRGVSLRTWDEIGCLEREVALYRRLQEEGVHVFFFTYGDRSDLDYSERLPGIRILCNRWNLPSSLYARFGTILHWRDLRLATVAKSNQTEGADAAILAKRLFGHRMIARCGFLWSLFFEAAGAFSYSYDAPALVKRERNALIRADKVVVTTIRMKKHAEAYHGVSTENIQVIPNYVLTQQFKPPDERRWSGRRLIYVGRLSPEKNLLGLIEAIQGLDVTLTLLGEGPLKNQLSDAARALGVEVHLEGSRPHGELPRFLGESDAFVLPSFSEGHPKALIEAMSCGLPVIGTDVPGIRDLVRHGETGLLCGTSPREIRASVLALLNDDSMKEGLGRRAREFVLENFSLERVFPLELRLLQSIVRS